MAPQTAWHTWVILSGRGWGKTRTGAEWLAYQAVNNDRTRWAVVAPTFSDARDTCVEGESGLQSVLNRYRMIHRWNRSLGELDLRNGSKIKLFSAEEPERLRGPQHHGAWCDELAAWRYDDAWTQLQFGLRLGEAPQTVVTTTPKPRKLLRGLLDRDTTETTTGSTFENADNLSPAALEELRALYDGTRTGRQELYGELLDDVEGALWTWKMIDDYRVTHTPDDVVRRYVAVDPAVTFTRESDETGIITAAVTGNGHIYVERDSTTRDTVDGWARSVCIEYERAQADAVIVESNQGGDMNESIIKSVDPTVNVRLVNATRGKRLRAEPVAALAEQGKIHHVGAFPDLEEQMTSWTPEDKQSPDRLDALVHAVTALTTTRVPQPAQLLRT
jgi:phage terminase large subunit-like protein